MTQRHGSAGRVLRIDLSAGDIGEMSTGGYAERFIGGRGVASRLYWDVMRPDIGAFDPENHLFFMNGPLAGTPAPGASRWIVLGKSPMAYPEQYAFGNLGGRFGAVLRRAGYDGLDIVGATGAPSIVVIDAAGRCVLEDAQGLWGKDAVETIGLLEERFGAGAAVAAIGRAGEVKVRFATIIASGGACATKGFGAVMGAKNLKAVIVAADRGVLPAACPEKLSQLLQEITPLWKGESSGRYWNDLLLQDVEKIKNEPCYGCPGICNRGLYHYPGGEPGYAKSCVAAYFYAQEEQALSGRMAEASFHATQLANRHGLCVLELRFLINWLPKAFAEGLLDPAQAGLDKAALGSAEWIERLIGQIISRRDVGDILAEGSRRSARALQAEHLLEGMVTRNGFDADLYNPRLFITNAPIYATEPVYPITQLHRVSFPMVKWMIWMATDGAMGFFTTEKLRAMAARFWGDVRAAEFDTAEAKGAAAAINQNRSYAMENMILCDWFWPIDYSGNADSGIGDPSFEARLYSAVTGNMMRESEYLRSGERCVNLCRAIYLREGRRGRVDDVLEEFNHAAPLAYQDPPVGLFNPEFLMPGKDGSVFERKGKTVDREMFRQVMHDYYVARGWDIASGLCTREGLRGLGLDELIPELELKGLIA